jgi:hypothetical protein
VIELNGKDIDKAGFLILHDKSYNPEACQQSVQRTWWWAVQN